MVYLGVLKHFTYLCNDMKRKEKNVAVIQFVSALKFSFLRNIGSTTDYVVIEGLQPNTFVPTTITAHFFHGIKSFLPGKGCRFSASALKLAVSATVMNSSL